MIETTAAFYNGRRPASWRAAIITAILTRRCSLECISPPCDFFNKIICLGRCLPNLKFVSLAILELLAFSCWHLMPKILGVTWSWARPFLPSVDIQRLAATKGRRLNYEVKEFSALHARNRTWRALLHRQSLKHKLKKCDLSLRLKECKLSAWRTAAGKLFHTTGPATEKALSPNFVLVRGTQCAGRRSERPDSVPNHCCCRGIQNRSGSMGTDVCGLWTSPVPAWTWFGTPLTTSATPSGQDAGDRFGTSQGRDVQKNR